MSQHGKPQPQPGDSDCRASTARRPVGTWHAIGLPLLLFAGAVSGIGIYAYCAAKRAVTQSIAADMEAVARLKVDQVRLWLAERQDDARFVMTPRAIGELQHWLAAGEPDNGEKKLQVDRLRFRIAGQYRNISLRSPTDGRLLLSSGEYPDTQTARERAVESAKSGTVMFDDFPAADGNSTSQRTFCVFSPVFPHEGGRPLAVIHMAIDPDRILFPLLQKWPGTSQSGETLLLRREGDQVVYLNALRPGGSSVMNLRHSLTAPNFVSAELAGKGEGFLTGDDYGGSASLVYGLPVPDTPWFLVAKMGRDEAFLQLNTAAALSSILLAALLVLCAGWLVGRRRTEEALRRSWEKTEDLYQNAPCGYHSLSSDGTFLRINDTGLKLLGYTREELVGRMKVQDLLVPESRDVFRKSFPRFMAEGTVKDLQFQFIRKDGTVLPALVSATAVKDRNGRFVMSRSVVTDITERLRTETLLAQMTRLYAVLSKANQAVVRISERDRLLEEICRIAVEHGAFVMAWAGHLEGERVVPVAKWGQEDGYLDEVRIIVLDRHMGSGPTGIAIREGRHHVCGDIATDPRVEPWRDLALARGYRSSAAFPIREDGKVVGSISLYAPEPGFFTPEVIGLLEDLTADISFALDAHLQAARRRTAEDELRLLNEQLERRVDERTRQLEQANKELEAFSYSVSHDLRAPLRSIDGFSDVLEKRYGDRLDGTGQDYLGRIRRASRRMGELIDDLLDFSQVAGSRLRRQPVDLTALARCVLEDVARNHPERRVRFTVQEGMESHGDLGLLRIILENLLGNAWKFTSHREVAEIECGSREENDSPVYFVRDNGAGFDDAYAHKLFQVFQRLHSDAEFEGTGIGLATVRRIVRRHGGEVWAEGKPDGGAVFYFTLPRQREEAVAGNDTNKDLKEGEFTP